MKPTTRLKPNFLLRWLAWIVLGLAIAGLSACATGQKLTDHAFSFDARWDSPDVEILNYRYGDSNLPGTRMPAALLREGGVSGSTGINGAFPRGDSLYVKWRIKATGEVFEDTVDMKSRLPEDITGQRIYFVIDGTQLYVYLISRDPKRGYLSSEEVAAADREANTPHKKALRKYVRHKIVTIYPDQPKLNKSN